MLNRHAGRARSVARDYCPILTGSGLVPVTWDQILARISPAVAQPVMDPIVGIISGRGTKQRSKPTESDSIAWPRSILPGVEGIPR